MALVVRVLESADHRGGGSDQFAELLLRESRALAKLENLSRNSIVGLGFCQFGDTLRTPFVVPPMNDLDGVTGWLAFLFTSHKSSLLERVDPGRLFVSSLSRKRHFDCAEGNSVLLGQAMREYRRDSAVREIENSIVDVVKSNSQFVYPIAKKVGLRPPQLVP